MPHDLQTKYRAWLAKIAELGARQEALYGAQIRCRKGCFSCCRPPDTLFQIEAPSLQQAVRDLAPPAKQRLQSRLSAYKAGEQELCPLLEDGGCTVYEARPVICRTHGYGVMLQDEQGAFLSWCHLNFDQVEPSAEVAFNVEHLNTVLSVMTRMGWPHAEPRPALVEILEQALDTSPPSTISPATPPKGHIP
ncbi:YkgJ family cysteine cluster protein [Myxococcota bacterium]|nr:YkgJ family cysteine cluster protein [Myxococcota bacterium]